MNNISSELRLFILNDRSVTVDKRNVRSYIFNCLISLDKGVRPIIMFNK